MKRRLAPIFCLSLTLAACASAPDSSQPGDTDKPNTGDKVTERAVRAPDMRGNQFILVEPAVPSSQKQVEIAQITQLIDEHDDELTDEQRAILLYRRGSLYDALGLTTLARVDFNEVLNYRPEMSDAYNYIGIHATQNGDFNAAYEAFDSALELDPDHPYVYLNRGIAAYYNGQYDLAQADFADYHYQQPEDAYRTIWLFLAEYEQGKARAYELLAERQTDVEDNWQLNLVRLFSGEINAQQLLASTLEGVEDQQMLTERLAEAYFYLGKYEVMQGYPEDAANYFKLALATNMYEFIEHRYAPLELARIRDEDSSGPE